MTRTLNLVLTHEPIGLFEPAARLLRALVAERSGGELAIQMVTPSELGGGTRVSSLEAARRVAAGEVEMGQTYTTVLGQLAQRMWALDLPFLFDSHEHGAEVLDGPIGREILADLAPAGLVGLAFTYSGGFRIVSSTGKRLQSIDDFAGLRVRTADNPVVVDMYERLGARPLTAPLYEIPALTANGLIDAAESTWPRYVDMGHAAAQPFVADTAHSLFLTAIVVNEAVWRSLGERLQGVLAGAALECARFERRRSVEDGSAARSAHGEAMIVWSARERERFADVTRAVYDRFAPVFGADLIARIRSIATRLAA